MAQDSQALLKLLQLVSPALPVGAYSYSEGLETLTQMGKVTHAGSLKYWLQQELRYGAIAVESAFLVKAYRSLQDHNSPALQRTNAWLSAFRETEELRSQSWQMGRSLARLVTELDPAIATHFTAFDQPLNFVVVFAIAAAHWQIDLAPALIGYLHSWAANLVNAGVRLIPLGQTQGQQVLLQLSAEIEQTAERVMTLAEDNAENDIESYVENCGWGLAIASMKHETLYSRLFRS